MDLSVFLLSKFPATQNKTVTAHLAATSFNKSISLLRPYIIHGLDSTSGPTSTFFFATQLHIMIYEDIFLSIQLDT